MNDLNNITFSTRNILATEKQKEFICSLIDNLDFDNDLYDYYEHYYDDVETMSKFEAIKLIQELKDVIDDYKTNSFWDMVHEVNTGDYL